MTAPVLVIHCGGTIGMLATPEGYATTTGFEQRLRDRLQPDQPVAFDWLELQPLIDSSAAEPADWLNIARLLRSCWQDYRGFVILHGTDTLAYTASALSFLLGPLDKPVIITGAQIPLSESRSDALVNVTNSLQLAANGLIDEVCVCFHDRLLRGNRCRKLHSEALGAFDSPAFPALAQLGIKLLYQPLQGSPKHKVELTALPEQMHAETVAMLSVYPGMTSEQLKWLLHQPGLRGLVLQTYGAGNPPKGLVPVLAKLIAAGVTIINVSQCISGGVTQGSYASASDLNRIGVISGGDLTPEAAFTKLHWLLACHFSEAQVKRLLQCSIAGECSAD